MQQLPDRAAHLCADDAAIGKSHAVADTVADAWPDRLPDLVPNRLPDPMANAEPYAVTDQ